MGVKFSQNDLRSRHRSFTTTVAAFGNGTLIVTGAVVIFGIHLAGDGTNAAILSIHDALTAVGTPITIKVGATGSAEFRFEPTGIRFTTGLFVQNDGAAGTPTAVVRYMAE